jgi:hypothetical protein
MRTLALTVLLLCSWFASQGQDAKISNHGQLSLHATVDAQNGNHFAIKPAGGPATVTCTSATGNPPPVGAPNPGCKVKGVGLAANGEFLELKKHTQTAGAGTVSLECFGGQAPLDCTASVQW